ncbi:MAG TPA: hypothetical protein VL948_19025 [Verrucomicrobiae bacterium]|jgi:hypothetical protein|nr:hypothetical protein [Verrucomicrobiae bacterium]
MKLGIGGPVFAALGLLAGALLAGPAWAGDDYAAGLSFLNPVPAAATSPTPPLDLSVVRDGSERTLRVPLASRDESRAIGRLVPYLSLGSSFLSDSSIRDSGVPYEDMSRAQKSGMDMGAGVAVKVSKRMELFGEYRFMRMNPDPTEAVGGGVLRRDVDGPYLKGGFSITLP